MSYTVGALAFDGTYTAAKALDELRVKAPSAAWIDEVGVIERHRSGRVSIRATYDGLFFEDEEGESPVAGSVIGGLTGALLGLVGGAAGAAAGAVVGGLTGGALGAADEADKDFFAYEDIKTALPKDSSALVLVADTTVLDEMAAAAVDLKGRVIRKALTEEAAAQLREWARSKA